MVSDGHTKIHLKLRLVCAIYDSAKLACERPGGWLCF